MSDIRLRVNESSRADPPAAVRQAVSIHPGHQVLARLEGDEVRITTRKHRIEQAQRHVRRFGNPERPLADPSMAGRRVAARHE